MTIPNPSTSTNTDVRMMILSLRIFHTFIKLITPHEINLTLLKKHTKYPFDEQDRTKSFILIVINSISCYITKRRFFAKISGICPLILSDDPFYTTLFL